MVKKKGGKFVLISAYCGKKKLKITAYCRDDKQSGNKCQGIPQVLLCYWGTTIIRLYDLSYLIIIDFVCKLMRFCCTFGRLRYDGGPTGIADD